MDETSEAHIDKATSPGFDSSTGSRPTAQTPRPESSTLGLLPMGSELRRICQCQKYCSGGENPVSVDLNQRGSLLASEMV